MKKLLTTLLFVLLAAVSAKAVPAYPGLLKVRQPDGTLLTVRLVGDEFLNFYTTADGYSIVKNESGGFVYATLIDGKLAPSSQIAHDAKGRGAAEQTFVTQLSKELVPTMTSQQQLLKASAMKALGTHKPSKDARYDYKKFRGLVILVNYTDRKFTYPVEVIDSMINEEGFKGFYNHDSIPQWQACTGSVRDYFEASSAGQFKPQFDVIGPIESGKKSTYVNQASSASTLFKAVLDSANAQIDYSKYDADGDGVVDMVFFLVAGPGAHYNGGMLLWPHASTLTGKTLDGVSFGRYACSVELRGLEDLSQYPSLADDPEFKLDLDGVGTICHEFSHVLGLRDEYDTNYSTYGKCAHPGDWSLMANGCYLNLGRTPCSYSLFERYQAGFTTPAVIDATGNYTVSPILQSNSGYRINTLQDNEYFLLENRQKNSWDEYLPGHGMLIFRVDSTDATVWANNTVNANASHPYYELLRAGGDTENPSTSSSASKLLDTDHDPFPGTMGITSIDNTTTPSLKTWAGIENDISLSDISENEGIISFSATKRDIKQIVEDFEKIGPIDTDTTGVTGSFTTWDFERTGVAVADSATSAYIHGSHAARFYRKGTLTSDKLNYALSLLKFTVSNPTSSPSYFRAFASTDDGASWTTLKTLTGASNMRVAAGDKGNLVFKVGTTTPARIRIEEFTGNSSEPLYVDNIALEYDSLITTGITELKTVNASTAVIRHGIYDLQGRKITNSSKLSGQLPKGIYIIDGRKQVVK